MPTVDLTPEEIEALFLCAPVRGFAVPARHWESISRKLNDALRHHCPFVDLGEFRPDGTPRTSYERWPNGAPT